MMNEQLKAEKTIENAVAVLLTAQNRATRKSLISIFEKLVKSLRVGDPVEHCHPALTLEVMAIPLIDRTMDELLKQISVVVGGLVDSPTETPQ
jgi:hypothetical protein